MSIEMESGNGAGTPCLTYAEGATAPHPHQVISGSGPSRVFLDSFGGPWTDREALRLGDLRSSNRVPLTQHGLIITAPGAGPTSSFRMRLKGRLVVPRDLTSQPARVPIVFIVMGNHAWLRSTGVPDVEVDNFEGYDYLQQTFADLGIASCSVDTNFANAQNLVVRSRAEILLDTIDLIRTRTPAPTLRKLDFDRVGLIGHSRGGDAVVLAHLLATARSLAFRTRCIASIAPTDFTRDASGRVDAAGARVPLPMRLSGAVRYLVLLGAHDGDVSGPSNNGFGHYDRATCDKTLVFARGLTHNRFNTVWNECVDYADGRHIFVEGNCAARTPGVDFDTRIFASVVHREYAKFFLGALLRRTLLGDARAEDVLRGAVAPSSRLLQQSPGQSGPAASVQWSVSSALSVDEFDAPGAGARSPASITLQRANAGRSSVPHDTTCFVARGAGERIRIDLAGRDLSARRELTFRLTSMIPITSEDTIARAQEPDWEIRLVTSRGTSACGPRHLDRRGLRPPNKPFFCQVYPLRGSAPAARPAPINVTKHQYDTLVVPLAAFANVDLRDVRALEFEARAGALPLLIDSLAFV